MYCFRRWTSLLMSLLLSCSVAIGEQGHQQSILQTAPPGSYKRIFRTLPMKNAGKYGSAFLRQSQSGATIPLWGYSLTSLGQQYSGMIVGRSPFFHGHRTTATSTLMIPVIFTFADTGFTFDPTTTDDCLGDSVVHNVSNSPIFQSVDWVMNGTDMGSTQYIDAFQRAEFWSTMAGTPYHDVMSLTVLPAIQVTVPAQHGVTEFGFCGAFGLMDIDWWDNMVQTSIIPGLANQGVNTSNFPLFLFDSVFEYEGDLNNCCVLGYHSAFMPGGVLQTYSIGSFDTSGTFGGDISIMSHEIGEWMNDPTTDNPTPAWGHIGQVQGCQGNFEVGDPLTGTLLPPVHLNNFDYSMQELAFFSWFYRQEPSIGVGGLYSNNGTFTTDAGPVCQ